MISYSDFFLVTESKFMGYSTFRHFLRDQFPKLRFQQKDDKQSMDDWMLGFFDVQGFSLLPFVLSHNALKIYMLIHAILSSEPRYLRVNEVNRNSWIVEWRSSHDDADRSEETGGSENPQEKPVEHHRDEFPILNDLRKEKDDQIDPEIIADFINKKRRERLQHSSSFVLISKMIRVV